VIAPYGYTNICCFTFKEQFASNSVTGGSGKLMVDEEKATAVVRINGTTGIPVARRTVSGCRYYPARDRGDEVIAADTVPRMHMSLLEKHLARRCPGEDVL
jgi:hypothetical protein